MKLFTHSHSPVPIHFLLMLMQIAGVSMAFSQIPGVQHVVIIGCDGMSPDGVRKAPTPVMDELMKEGAFTLHARGVMPTVSSPNWASMIMGAGPEQHGVTSNDWETNFGLKTPDCWIGKPIKAAFEK